MLNRLEQVLAEQTVRGKPAVIKHKNGKIFEVSHHRLVRSIGGMRRGMYIMVIGLGEGPGPLINHKGKPGFTFLLPDFYRTWSEELMESNRISPRWVSQSWFKKVFTMNPENIANLAELIKR